MDRKSRLPLSKARSSSINSPARRSRSSTAIPRSVPSFRSRSTTPNSAYRRPKSPLIKKDTRPLDNKKWQKNQTARVEAFIQQFEPDIKKLRPLSTNTFVVVLHHLINNIHESSNITAANYKTELADILNNFQYCNKLSPSTIKWPNTEHAYPTILGVFSFLLDKIEALDEIEDLYQVTKQENYEMAKFLPTIGIQKYVAVNASTFLDNLEVETERILIKNPMDHKMEEKELYALKNKLYSAEEDMKKCDKEQKDLDEEIATKKDALYKLNQKIEETGNNLEGFLKKLENTEELLDLNIERKNTELDNIQKKISLVGVSEEDIAKMEQKIIDSKYTNSLLKERDEANMNKISQLDLLLAQQKRQIECTVFGINNILRDIRCHIGDMEPCFLPETGFTNLNYLEIIKENDVTFFNNKLHQLGQDLKNLEQNKEHLIIERQKKSDKLQTDYSEKLKVFKQYTKINGNVKKEVNSLENHVEILLRETEEAESSKIDLKPYIDLNVQAQVRKKKLMEALCKQDEQMKVIHTQARKVSVECNGKLTKLMESGICLLNSQQKVEIDLINDLTNTTKTKLSQLKQQYELLKQEVENSEGMHFLKDIKC